MNPKPSTAGAKLAADISAYFRSRTPLILMVTREEARAERIVVEAAAAANQQVSFWDCANGVTSIDGKLIDGTLTDAGLALANIRDNAKRCIWVMRDLHKWLADPNINRALRSLCRTLPQTPREQARAIVITSPSGDVPPEIAAHAIVIDVPLPDRAEIGELLDNAIAGLPEELRANAAPNGKRDDAIDAAMGLTSDEIASTYSRSIIKTEARTIEAPMIAAEKKRVISASRVLEWIDPIADGLDAVGGNEEVKAWLMERKLAFSKAAKGYGDFGLPAPKGVGVVGTPGCGKSLLAKCVATAWGVPLIKLDPGALKSKFVGDSEANLRKALKTIEAIGRSVLWIDEVDKAMPAAGLDANDGGVAADQISTILNWQQERVCEAFLFVTANDGWRIPAPLMRKERLDEIFFVDLPTTSERSAIVKAALRKYRPPGADAIDTDAVAAVTADFIGAELASLVPTAMYAGFADGARPITTADLLTAAKALVPLAKTQSDQIKRVRDWAQGKARPASKPEAVTAAQAGRALDI